jgi:hypothetical protein
MPKIVLDRDHNPQNGVLPAMLLPDMREPFVERRGQSGRIQSTMPRIVPAREPSDCTAFDTWRGDGQPRAVVHEGVSLFRSHATSDLPAS